MKEPKPRFAYVKNPHGDVIDIPEKHVKMTLQRAGFEFISWADEEQEEIESMFEDDHEVGVIPGATPQPAMDIPNKDVVFQTPDHIGHTNKMVVDKTVDKNNYNRSPQDEKSELDALNAKDDIQLAGFSAPSISPVDTEEVDSMFNEDESVQDTVQDGVQDEPKPATPAQKPPKVVAPKKKPAAPKKK